MTYIVRKTQLITEFLGLKHLDFFLFMKLPMLSYTILRRLLLFAAVVQVHEWESVALPDDGTKESASILWGFEEPYILGESTSLHFRHIFLFSRSVSRGRRLVHPHTHTHTCGRNEPQRQKSTTI